MLWVNARRLHWRANFSGHGMGPGMLSSAGSLRVFVAVEACDMRKG